MSKKKQICSLCYIASGSHQDWSKKTQPRSNQMRKVSSFFTNINDPKMKQECNYIMSRPHKDCK